MRLPSFYALIRTKNIAALIAISTLVGCNQKTASDRDTASKDSIQTPTKDSAATLKFDHSIDNLARFMAALPQTQESPVKEIENKAFWKSYRSSFDSSWNTIVKTRLQPMKQWASRELTVANTNGLNLFYPFGGPDFLNANTLFPNAKTYTLIGLEPVGSVPDLTTFDEKAQTDYLFSIHDALGDIFKRSYFITRKMVHDMHNNQISGTVPLLYVFLARTNNTITNIQYVGINNITGALEDYTVDAKNRPLSNVSPGVRIDFLPEGSNEVHHLYYFKINLLDAALKTTPGVKKYIADLGTVNTYVKSASYLMHYLTFNDIREAVMKQSATLLQDDSGIAYRFFDKNAWDFKFYGRYMKPVNDFNWVFEKDLQEVYQKDTTIQPVPFILGYHWDSNGINLLRAIKKTNTNINATKDTLQSIKK